jgi:hypothetical protein
VKLIIAGGRDLTVTQYLIDAALNHHHISFGDIKEVVSGACGRPDDEFDPPAKDNKSGPAWGIDGCGEKWACNHQVRIKRFPAQWKKLKRLAGPTRNGEMAAYADVLLLIWDGESKGSASMKR